LRDVGERITAFSSEERYRGPIRRRSFCHSPRRPHKAENAFAAHRNSSSAFAAPFLKQEQDVYLTPASASAFYPEDGVDGDALVKHAQSAMHQAKRGGGNAFQFYTQELKYRRNRTHQAG